MSAHRAPSRRALAAAAAAIPLLACSHRAPAVAVSWTGPSSIWSKAANWSTLAVPNPNDDVSVVAGASDITVSLDTNAPPGFANSFTTFTLDSTSPLLAATLSMTSGNAFAARTQYIGFNNRGVVLHSAGVNNVSNTLNVGDFSGTGTYSLSGSGTVNAGVISVGPGAFTQTGGNDNVTSTLYVGVASPGSYSLSGGSVSTRNLNAGQNGPGTFTQSGGSVAVSSTFSVAVFSPGSYALSAGSLTLNGASTTPAEYVGYSSSGTFNHTGGVHSLANGTLFLGYNASGTGSYNLTGPGTLIAPNLTLAEAGAASFTQSDGAVSLSNSLVLSDGGPAVSSSYSLSGGTLSAPTELLGHVGAATFTQSAGTHSAASSTLGDLAGSSGVYNLSGGTHAVTNTLTLASVAGSSASYSLSGSGSLTANTEYVAYAGNAAFTQSGGSNALPGTLALGNVAGAHGSYSLSGGASLSAGVEYVGVNGAGTFAQTGGAHAVSTELLLAFYPNSAASFLLAGGSLSGGVFEYVGYAGNASFAHTAGSNTLVGSLFVAYAPGSSASYSLSSTGSLAVGASAFIGGGIDGPGGAGSLVISGGSASVGGTLHVFDTPGTSLALTGGTLSLSSPASLDAPNPSRVSWTGGTLNFTAGYTLDNAFSFGNLQGPHLTLTPAFTLSSGGPATNAGSITLAGGALAGTGTLSNNASLTGFGRLAQPTTNFGTLLPTDTGITLSATLTNSATLNLNSSAVTGPGSLINSPDGLILGPGTLSTASFSNQGLLSVPAGTTRITPSFTNTGVIDLTSNTANLAGPATLTNAATLQGNGKVSLPINNAGTIEPLNSSTLTLAGPLTNTGLLAASSNNKLLITGNFPTNAGTISLTGGTLDASSQPLINSGSITGYGTLRTAGLTNNGSITLTGGTTTVTGPVTNNASHTIKLQYTPAIFAGPVTNNGSIQILNGASAVFAAGLTGNAPSSPTGLDPSSSSSSFILQPSSFSSLSLDSTSSAVTPFISQDSLTNSGALTLLPSSQGGAASTLNTLTLLPASTFDLADNALTVTGTPVATLRSYLLNHQLFSSLSDQTHTLGYIPGLLVKLTLTGDANLDGAITADDYALLDSGFSTGASTWWKGDFNYDGTVNSSDYLLIDTTLALQQGGHLSPAFLSQRESQFGPAYVSALLASVPEPVALSSILYPLSSYFLLTRRRRTNHSI